MIDTLESTGAFAPWLFVALFMAASLLMVWRLEAMMEGGFEGTVLGTLITPYCSGMGNLIFAFIVGREGGSGEEVMTNSLVNNVTNMTLLIGLPAIIWGMKVLPGGDSKKKKVTYYSFNWISLLELYAFICCTWFLVIRKIYLNI